jgi:hypothetical protein
MFSTIVLVFIGAREPTGWLFAGKMIAAKTGNMLGLRNYSITSGN